MHAGDSSHLSFFASDCAISLAFFSCSAGSMEQLKVVACSSASVMADADEAEAVPSISPEAVARHLARRVDGTAVGIRCLGGSFECFFSSAILPCGKQEAVPDVVSTD